MNPVICKVKRKHTEYHVYDCERIAIIIMQCTYISIKYCCRYLYINDRAAIMQSGASN